MDILQKMQIIFSNREMSTFIWIIIAIILLLFIEPIRKSFKGVLRVFFQWKILVNILFALSYSFGIVYLLFYFGFWDSFMLKDSILWFIVSAFIILMNLSDASKKKKFFKKLLFDNLKIMIVFEFVVNIYNFSLLGELLFIPIIVFIVIIQTISETKEEYKKVGIFFKGILSVIGVIMLVLSIKDIVMEINVYASFDTLKSFFLPIILTLSFIPCAYLIALVMEYELLFVRIGFYLTDKKNRRYAKRRTFFKCGFSLSRMNKLSPQINSLYTTIPRSGIKEIIN